MKYWLLVTYPENFKKCIENKVWGVGDSLLPIIKNARVGDEIYFHITGMKAGGIFTVTREFFEDKTKMWEDGLYPYRIGIEPKIMPPTPIDIRDFFSQNFKVGAAGYFWKPMRTLQQNEFELFKEFISKGNIETLEKPVEPAQDNSFFALSIEKDLEEYLEKNLESLEKGLRLYQKGEDRGRQFNVSTGRIDLLAIDKNSNIVVLELKAGEADISTFGQLSAYMGAVQKELASGGPVRGIIVANDFDEKIKSAVLITKSISLKKYNVSFDFKDA